MKTLSPSSLNYRGFTIIEMTLVLTIMASFVVVMLDLSQKRIEQNKIEATKATMNSILWTLEHYVRKNGRLPCPADPTVAYTHADFGIEKLTSGVVGDCGYGSGDGAYAYGGSTPPYSAVYGGVIPVYELQLPPSMMFDAWGRPFSYQVDEHHTATGAMDDASATTLGVLNVASFENTVHEDNLCDVPKCVYSPGTYAQAVMVLISHGKNGYGAWPGMYGGATRTAISSSYATTQEVGNADSNNARSVQAPLTTKYDDIVMFRRAWQFPDKCATTDCIP